MIISQNFSSSMLSDNLLDETKLRLDFKILLSFHVILSKYKMYFDLITHSFRLSILFCWNIIWKIRLIKDYFKISFYDIWLFYFCDITSASTVWLFKCDKSSNLLLFQFYDISSNDCSTVSILLSLSDCFTFVTL